MGRYVCHKSSMLLFVWQVVDDCRGMSSFEFAHATGQGSSRTYLLRSPACDDSLSSVLTLNVASDGDVRRLRPMQYALMTLVQVCSRSFPCVA